MSLHAMAHGSHGADRDSDVVVVGAGPAALCITAALSEQQLHVVLLSDKNPWQPWQNTYGIWGHEADEAGLASLLSHRWQRCSSFFCNTEIEHGLDYGLFDRQRLQRHWRRQCEQGGVEVRQDCAVDLCHDTRHSWVKGVSGTVYRCRLLVDASGHQPVFVQRPRCRAVAGQAAYGIVGRFRQPPITPGSFVLMDYRNNHLTGEEREEPPSFLYAMDLGDDVYFVEETSLAAHPPLPFNLLQRRLERRLAARNTAVESEREVERCLFPMNLPLPDRQQRVVGFGGAATMVHPASGYMLGSLLRRAPGLAATIAQDLADGHSDGATVSRKAWRSLWSNDLVRRHGLYRFGLEKLMRFPEADLQAFFLTFFRLPQRQWAGFLTNTMPFGELTGAMMHLFANAPWTVRWGLAKPENRELGLLLQGLLLR